MILLCVKGDDEDGGDYLAPNGKPEDEDRVVNVAQLSDNQNYDFQSNSTFSGMVIFLNWLNQ